ncbi:MULTISPECIES: hypothetical protein [Pseudomonas]|uniref:PcfJ-like protein n=1 Tax=Pseudomonas quercus TaxID=2722792 RepID=A0ABX0YF53_9PSED|nr:MULTISPECIES: hypothetical protein [Pseudomonas]MBF7143069.1 hypothetical protein [Pseudomonas sp. LY10J]NJP01902.1 hypothetical protein [Pseudomonas quercus]
MQGRNDYAFKGLWARYQNANACTTTLDEVADWAASKGLSVIGIQRREVGAFSKTDCIVIQTTQGSGCFPADPAACHEHWGVRHKEYSRISGIWEKLEWFSPLWISRKHVTQILQDAERLEPVEAIKSFDYHTSTIYTLPFEAVCIEQVMGSAECLKDVQPLAREAFLAFYAGYKAASIAALIPAIEGAISKILPPETHALATMERVNRVIEGAVQYAADIHYEEMWTPPEYRTTDYLFCMDEHVFAFETFRRWLQNCFYQRTEAYTGATNLNRHLFAHGISADWQKASLSRLIVALATIGTIEAWYRKDSSSTLFFPEQSEESRLLWEQAILHGSAQMVIKQIEAASYHQHGRRVPVMPSDDGAMLRRALLMDDCIKDLVRPMREAGWAVSVQENDSDLYVIVVGRSGKEKIKVALLYSCGAENGLYKELAQDCQAILYRGAPYKQSQFAWGITVHVGPVAGWQPPRPQEREGEDTSEKFE